MSGLVGPFFAHQLFVKMSTLFSEFCGKYSTPYSNVYPQNSHLIVPIDLQLSPLSTLNVELMNFVGFLIDQRLYIGFSSWGVRRKGQKGHKFSSFEVYFLQLEIPI